MCHFVVCDDLAFCKYYEMCFLPPPVLSKQTSNGYVTMEKEVKFVPLLLQLSLDLRASLHLKPVPYESNCRSVETYLFKRPCGICELYFASYKVTKQHKQSYKMQQEVLPIEKIRPLTIAARRARKIRCLEDDNDAIRLDEKDVDPTNVLTLIPKRDRVTSMPVINDLKKWVQSPWTQGD